MEEGQAEQMETRRRGWAGGKGDLLVKRPWKVKVGSPALAKSWGRESTGSSWVLKAGTGVELSTPGEFGWVERGMNHLSRARAHSAPLETKASLQSCSRCTERKDEDVQRYREQDFSKHFLGNLSLSCSALHPGFKHSHKDVKMKQGTSS